MSETNKTSAHEKLPFWYRHPQIRRTFIFAGIWGLVFLCPLLGMLMFARSESAEGWFIVHRSWIGLCPYFAVAIINEYFLLPVFYMHRRIFLYSIGLVLTLSAFTFYQSQTYKTNITEREHHIIQKEVSFSPPAEVKGPLFINISLMRRLSIAVLIVGWGLGYNIVLRYRRKLHRARELERDRLQQELRGLKAQISPHFFMNMLNNIHGAMESDPKRAQSMLLKLSHMMRYVTYDTALERVPLTREVDFIRSYIELMSTRYPADRVTISASFPDEQLLKMISVPPLLFISFIENAFKHGVTYRKHTDIKICLQITSGNRLLFSCFNTIPSTDTTKSDSELNSHHGVGLSNVRKRLEMLYGTDFNLEVRREIDKKEFFVELEIPAHETEMYRD